MEISDLEFHPLTTNDGLILRNSSASTELAEVAGACGGDFHVPSLPD
jgi:hypothetical protein